MDVELEAQTIARRNFLFERWRHLVCILSREVSHYSGVASQRTTRGTAKTYVITVVRCIRTDHSLYRCIRSGQTGTCEKIHCKPKYVISRVHCNVIRTVRFLVGNHGSRAYCRCRLKPINRGMPAMKRAVSWWIDSLGGKLSRYCYLAFVNSERVAIHRCITLHTVKKRSIECSYEYKRTDSLRS